jgi:hypothetical protein
MNYELSLLNEWISNSEHNDNDTAFLQEVARIRQQWINAAIEGNDAATFTRYIRLHQLELLHLMEICHPQQAHPCLAALESLYLFLVERFPSDADYSKTVPADHLPAFREQVAQQLAVIKEQAVKWSLHEKLTEAITEPLEKIIADVPGNFVRTGRIRFIQEMLPAVVQILIRGDAREQVTKSLVDLLCHLNLNSVLFYKTCCLLITEELAKEKQSASKAARLQRLQEHFLNLPVKRDMAYKADARVITAWIAGWISRQLSQSETPDALQPVKRAKRIKLPEEDKIKTSLAIPELSTFLRLFFMSGVFINDNKRKVAAFMATYVTSLATGSIQVRSAKSIYNKMYDMDSKTLESVERILHRMQDKLQDLRGELDDRQQQNSSKA